MSKSSRHSVVARPTALKQAKDAEATTLPGRHQVQVIADCGNGDNSTCTIPGLYCHPVWPDWPICHLAASQPDTSKKTLGWCASWESLCLLLGMLPANPARPQSQCAPPKVAHLSDGSSCPEVLLDWSQPRTLSAAPTHRSCRRGPESDRRGHRRCSCWAQRLSSPMMITAFFGPMTLSVRTQRGSTHSCSKVSWPIGRTPRGSCNRTLLRRVLRRFFKGNAFLERVLRRHLDIRVSVGTGVLRRVLRRRGCYRRRLEGA